MGYPPSLRFVWRPLAVFFFASMCHCLTCWFKSILGPTQRHRSSYLCSFSADLLSMFCTVLFSILPVPLRTSPLRLIYLLQNEFEGLKLFIGKL